jgi:hypothetical protein
VRLAAGDLAGADLARTSCSSPRPSSTAGRQRRADRGSSSPTARCSPIRRSTSTGCCTSPPTGWSPRRGLAVPARPALVTSFGDSGSDGLLTFREIFDLKLDADVVILSACDTAGMATVGASREAGVTTGGNYALDGLVRAFVGAGARSVVASHWPVPDDFDATKRLIGGLLDAGPGRADGGGAGERAGKADGRSADLAPVLLGGVHHPGRRSPSRWCRRRRRAAGTRDVSAAR